MKLTILGSGVASSHFGGPLTHRFPPAYLGTWDSTQILFDCSELVRHRLEWCGIDSAPIQHIALSHAHPDHCALVQFVQAQLCKALWGGEKFKNQRLTIYGPSSLTNGYQAMFKAQNPDLAEEQFPYPKVHFVDPTTESVRIEACTIKAAAVYHAFGKIDVHAFRVESPDGVFVYSGDSSDCDELRSIATNADLFLCEASAPLGKDDIGRRYGHMTANQVGALANAAKVKTLILTHYTGLDDRQALVEACRGGGFHGDLYVCDDFEQYELRNGNVTRLPDRAVSNSPSW